MDLRGRFRPSLNTQLTTSYHQPLKMKSTHLTMMHLTMRHHLCLLLYLISPPSCHLGHSAYVNLPNMFVMFLKVMVLPLDILHAPQFLPVCKCCLCLKL